MPLYRALERGYAPVIDAQPVHRPEDEGRRVVHRVVEPGELFHFVGEPGHWMELAEPDDKPAKRPKASGAPGKPPESNQHSGEQDDPGAP